MPEAQSQSALFPGSVVSSLRSTTTTTYQCVWVLPELAEKAATLSHVDQTTYYFAISTKAAVAWYGYLGISFTWNVARTSDTYDCYGGCDGKHDLARSAQILIGISGSTVGKGRYHRIYVEVDG
jgi:hypothetical protein